MHSIFDNDETRIETIGRIATEEVQLKIQNGEKDCKIGEVGEIVVKSSRRMLNYYKDITEKPVEWVNIIK